MISLKTRWTKLTVMGTKVATVKAGELELKEAEAARWLSKEEYDEVE